MSIKINNLGLQVKSTPGRSAELQTKLAELKKNPIITNNTRDRDAAIKVLNYRLCASMSLVAGISQSVGGPAGESGQSCHHRNAEQRKVDFHQRNYESASEYYETLWELLTYSTSTFRSAPPPTKCTPPPPTRRPSSTVKTHRSSHSTRPDSSRALKSRNIDSHRSLSQPAGTPYRTQVSLASFTTHPIATHDTRSTR